MAKIIYTPEGGSKREWHLDPANPAWDVAFATEKATGWPWGEFAQRMTQGSYIAYRALIWTLRKRDEPRLELDSVQITMAEVAFEEEEEAPAAEPESGEA